LIDLVFVDLFSDPLPEENFVADQPTNPAANTNAAGAPLPDLPTAESHAPPSSPSPSLPPDDCGDWNLDNFTLGPRGEPQPEMLAEPLLPSGPPRNWPALPSGPPRNWLAPRGMSEAFAAAVAQPNGLNPDGSKGRWEPVYTHTRAAGIGDCPVLFFDLETIPDEARLNQFDLPPLPELPPERSSAECGDPAEWLRLSLDALGDRIKREQPEAAFLELLVAEEGKAAKPRAGVADRCQRAISARREVVNAEEDRRRLLATTPEFCRIVALGTGEWWSTDSRSTHGFIATNANNETDDSAERVLLQSFWSKVRTARQIGGYNVLAFDLPVILARSILLGVEPTRKFDLARPWGQVVDLMRIRYGNAGFGKPAKLKALARCYGLAPLAEGCDGSQVEALYRSGFEGLEKLADYVQSDVDLCLRLYSLWTGYFC
jgi:hypothetical protein